MIRKEPSRRRYIKYIGGAVTLVAVGAAGYQLYAFKPYPQEGSLHVSKRKKEGEIMEKYKLPPLPYKYDALEPTISKEIVTIHHDKHHNGYVKGANATLDKLTVGRETGFDGVDIRALERNLAFNVSGHVLHSLYWQNMSPNGGGTPGGRLADMITDSFGSFEHFKTQLSHSAKQVEGSGWGLLVYEPVSAQLLTLQVQNHQNLLVPGCIPLLTVDVWEHAYYLQYKNDRGSYVDEWWNLVNWDDVEKRITLIT